jgi:GH25 family lysozyme M1 (1,4-beta-N-acetylmuramidase)
MILTDRRLRRAQNLEDLVFRFYYRDEDNPPRRIAIREIEGLLGQGFTAPDNAQIWGIDISDWDGNVNLQVSCDAGAKFAFIKAMDGTIPAKYWTANNARAIEADLPHAPYAWLYPDNRVSCTLQARAYWELIKNTYFELPPVIDFEWTRYAGLQANPTYADLDRWVTEFIRVSGIKPILYSAAGYMNQFGVMPEYLRQKFAGVWWAAYGVGCVYPYGFTSYDCWQFSSFGDALTLAPGDRDKRELDLNYMTPTFYSRYVGEIPQQEGNTMAKNKVTITYSGGARERQGPHATGNYGVILPPASVHYSDFDPIDDMDFPGDLDRKWIKLQSGWYVATRYPSSSGVTERCRVEAIPVAPAPADEITVSIEADIVATFNGKPYHGVVMFDNVQLRPVE